MGWVLSSCDIFIEKFFCYQGNGNRRGLVRCGSFVWFWGTVSRAGPPSPTGTSKVSGIPGLNFVVVLGHVSYFTP